MTLTLGSWIVTPLAVMFVLVCLFMMLVILIQKPRGGGLSGAFGGAGGSAQAAFGAKTGDVLTWFTVLCFGGFLVLAMGLTWATRIDSTEAADAEPVITIPVDSDDVPAMGAATDGAVVEEPADSPDPITLPSEDSP